VWGSASDKDGFDEQLHLVSIEDLRGGEGGGGKDCKASTGGETRKGGKYDSD